MKNPYDAIRRKRERQRRTGSTSKMVRENKSIEKTFVYVVKVLNPKNRRAAHYIGVTKLSPEDRLLQHKSGKGNLFIEKSIRLGFEVTITKTIEFDDRKSALKYEAQAIRLFSSKILNIKEELGYGAESNTLNLSFATKTFSRLKD
jgi:predicted GIY-YIG superfamily endonuclease